MNRNNALAIGAASFASTSKDTADSAARRETPNPFRVDEAMCGYAETPENREALKKLFDEAKPTIKGKLPANFNFGTKAICAPTPMEIELDKMYKGPYKTPQEKEWDTMLKR